MAQKKQPFRFRIPWLSGALAARHATEPLPRRPKDRSKSPTEPVTNVTIQRPPPPTPTPTQTQTQASPRAEPQRQQSPSRPPQPPISSVTIESETPSRPTTPTRVNSPLPSPSSSPSRTIQTHASSPSSSPSHADSPSPVSSLSSSPKTQPPQSPSHLDLGRAFEEPKPVVEESTLPASTATSTATEQEKEKMVVSEEPMPRESAEEPKVKSPLKTIPTSPPETTFQPQRMSTQPTSSEYSWASSSVPSSPTSQPQSSSSPHLTSESERTSKDVLKPTIEETTLPASSASDQQEKGNMAASEPPMLQESEPKMKKSPLKIIPKSPSETSSQPEKMSIQPIGSEYSRASSSVSSSPTSQSQLSSSSRLASESEDTREEVLKPTVEETTLPSAFASDQQEKGNMVVSEPPMLQESEQNMKHSPLKIIPKSPPETSSQPEKMSRRPIGISGDEKRLATPDTKKQELDSVTGISKSPLETQSKLHQSEEKEKVVQEPVKVGKANDATTGQPNRRIRRELHTTASGSGTQTRDPFTRSFKKQQEVRETVDRKLMFATSSSREKDIGVVSSPDQETRNISSSSISPEKPILSKAQNAPLLQKGIKDEVSKFVHKLAAVHPTQPVDDTDKPVSVLTLAGDNRGATMQIGSESAKKEGSIHIDRAYKTVPEPEESTEVTTDDVEENTKPEGSHSLNSTENDEAGKAYINSNIQGINNSLMFHGSINERDPGVQMILPRKPTEPIKPEDDKRGLETW